MFVKFVFTIPIFAIVSVKYAVNYCFGIKKNIFKATHYVTQKLHTK